MDAERPAPDLRYVDIHSELYDHGLEDVVDIYSLPRELLATLGHLGMGGANELHQYAREKILLPLGLLRTSLKTRSDVDSSIVEIAKEDVAIKEEVISVEKIPVGEDVAIKEEELEVVGQAVDNRGNSPRIKRKMHWEAIIQWQKEVSIAGSFESEEVDELASVDGDGASQEV